MFLARLRAAIDARVLELRRRSTGNVSVTLTPR